MSARFLEIPRTSPPKRPVGQRVRDWEEVEGDLALPVLQEQAGRCMSCGVPFCHGGCPLGNHVPEWNEHVREGRWREAADALHATNNFPEWTGRVCPAPCEQACVLNLEGAPVTIEHIEKQIVERAWAEGWIEPRPAASSTGLSVAVVGSGPAGLAAAQQLARAGHAVTVLERDARLGGLLRYGIPDFKLDKRTIDRRLAQLEAEGVAFRTGVEVGRDTSLDALRAEHDAVLLAVGAQRGRDMPLPGRALPGVHLAMEYLVGQNRVVGGERPTTHLDAAGKRVVVLGGGDTGADCVGTAHRQGAAEVFHFHYKPAPPSERSPETPWPYWPMVAQATSSHEEGGVRGWSLVTKAFLGKERLEAMRVVEVEWVDGRMQERPGTERNIPADLALLAIGFTGPDSALDCAATEDFRTATAGLYACGDARTGPALVVNAIWEGREAARNIDADLVGEARLPTLPDPTPLNR